MTAVSTNSDRRNAISGVVVAKVDRKNLIAFLKESKIEHEKDDTNEALSVLAFNYFHENTPTDDQVQCDDCFGISSIKLDACPYCGVKGEVEAKAPEAAPQTTSEPVAAKSETKSTKESTAMTTTEPTTSKKNGLAKPSKKKADAAPPPAPVDSKDLDQAVQNIQGHIAEGATAMWKAGKELIKVYAPQLWKQRTVVEDNKIKQTHKTFESFCTKEIGVTPNHAYGLMDVAEHFTEEQVLRFGTSRLTLVLQAPEKEQPKLLKQVEQGASWRDVKKEVTALKKKTGHRRPTRKGASKGNRDTTAATKAREEKRAKAKTTQVTVAKLLGRETVKLFCKPSGKVDPKDYKPAKKMGDLPWGKLEMVNGIEEEFFLQAGGDGSWKLVVVRKRVES